MGVTATTIGFLVPSSPNGRWEATRGTAGTACTWVPRPAGEILVSAGTLDGAGDEVEPGTPRTARWKGVAEAVSLVPVVWT